MAARYFKETLLDMESVGSGGLVQPGLVYIKCFFFGFTKGHFRDIVSSFSRVLNQILLHESCDFVMFITGNGTRGKTR